MASTLELEKYTSHAIIFNITTQLSAALFFHTTAGRWHKEFSSGCLGFLGWAVPAPEREPLRGCQIGCQGLSWRCHLSGRCAEVINGLVRQPGLGSAALAEHRFHRMESSERGVGASCCSRPALTGPVLPQTWHGYHTVGM